MYEQTVLLDTLEWMNSWRPNVNLVLAKSTQSTCSLGTNRVQFVSDCIAGAKQTIV